MVGLENLAYPYANAVFAIAEASSKLDEWAMHLSKISALITNPDVNGLIKNPQVENLEVINLCLDLSDKNSLELKNFLGLLDQNDRLLILPEIYKQFELLVAKKKNATTATIQSAFALTSDEKSLLEQQLSKRFAKTVSSIIEVVPELIGGVKILIDDVIIDSSVKGSLEAMATAVIQ